MKDRKTYTCSLNVRLSTCGTCTRTHTYADSERVSTSLFILVNQGVGSKENKKTDFFFFLLYYLYFLQRANITFVIRKSRQKKRKKANGLEHFHSATRMVRANIQLSSKNNKKTLKTGQS